MLLTTKQQTLYTLFRDQYQLEIIKSRLIFHGWPHIQFITKKSLEFAEELKADSDLVMASSLAYGLIYSGIYGGKETTIDILKKVGFDKKFIENVFKIMVEIQLSTRGSEKLSPEGMALSDAESVFRILPTTPLFFSQKYINQNDFDIESLANKILTEQEPLLEKDILFYSDNAKSAYNFWARQNLDLWKSIKRSLVDESVKELIDESFKLRSLFGQYKLAVGAIILNNKNEVLLAQRDMTRDNAPGSWEIIYGRLHQGEDPKEAVVREVKEEVSLDVSVVQILSLKNFYRTKNDLEHVAIVFLTKSNTNDVVMQKDEVMSYKWVELEKAKEMIAEYDKFLIDETIKIVNK